MVSRFFLLGCAAIVANGCGESDFGNTDPCTLAGKPMDVTGTWEITEPITGTLTLQQLGEGIKGTASVDIEGTVHPDLVVWGRIRGSAFRFVATGAGIEVRLDGMFETLYSTVGGGTATINGRQLDLGRLAIMRTTPIPDDHADTQEQGTTLLVGRRVFGMWLSSDDYYWKHWPYWNPDEDWTWEEDADWFRFIPEATGPYDFSVEGGGAGSEVSCEL
ncbi:MAG: hypothetical protein V2A73_09545, partial [Pseudomonadota bacterium]